MLVGDSTTVNLYKVLRRTGGGARRRPDRPARRVPDRPLRPPGARRGDGRELRPARRRSRGRPPATIEEALTDSHVAVVVLSHVNYRTGALADLAAITAAAPAGVPLVLGTSPIRPAPSRSPRAAGADLAVGCTYKYLNGGPGSPAFLYVAHELAAAPRSPIQGWFAQAEQFAMGHPFVPRERDRGFLAGTPAILDLAAVEAGVELTSRRPDADTIRAKSVALTESDRRAADARLGPARLLLGTPRDHAAARGAHVSLRHPGAWPGLPAP